MQVEECAQHSSFGRETPKESWRLAPSRSLMTCDILLTNYHPAAGQPYLFPGRFGSPFQPDSADKALRKACFRVGLEGVSSHSFRRSALTPMSDALIPLRIVQEVSGHRNLSQLQHYLEVRDSQVLGAVNTLSMLSPVSESGIGTYSGLEEDPLSTSIEGSSLIEQDS